MLTQLHAGVREFVLDARRDLCVLLAGENPGLDQLDELVESVELLTPSKVSSISPYRAGPTAPTTQISCIA
jgi:hypothetical protein